MKRRVAKFKDPVHAEVYASALIAVGIEGVEVVSYSSSSYYFVEWKV